MMPVRQMKRIDRLLKGWRESEAGEGSRVFFRSRRKNREKAIISIMATDHCWTVPKASGVKIRREIRPFSRVLSMKLIILITPHPNPLPKHPHPKKGGQLPIICSQTVARKNRYNSPFSLREKRESPRFFLSQ